MRSAATPPFLPSRGFGNGPLTMAPPDSLSPYDVALDHESLAASDESGLAALLDANRHDPALHKALIALDNLPEKIADRLLRLINLPSLREQLIIKHPFSAAIDQDVYRSSRHRPSWWALSSFR